jgi:hypothetical protein
MEMEIRRKEFYRSPYLNSIRVRSNSVVLLLSSTGNDSDYERMSEREFMKLQKVRTNFYIQVSTKGVVSGGASNRYKGDSMCLAVLMASLTTETSCHRGFS